MRKLFAALALAGGLCAACSPAFADMARDVVDAVGLGRDVRAIVTQAAIAGGVPPRLALGVARVESGFNPRLRGRAGEYGLFQMKCQTARGLGFAGACAALLDPAVNARWGVKHLRLALARGSVGFHQAGLGARHVSRAYVARINAAMR